MDIAAGHMITAILWLLGDFASVTATSATRWPKAAVHSSTGHPTGQTVDRTSEDQLVFTGVLKSGAIVSFHFRGLAASKPGRVPFEWIIDGEQGTIRVESNSSFYHAVHPSTVTIMGEKWTPSEPLVDYTGNVASAWEEIAKGAAGHYPTFHDAYKSSLVIDAVRRSAKDGVRVLLK